MRKAWLAAAVSGAVVLAASGAAGQARRPGTDPLRRLQYGLDRVQAEAAWTRARGAGVAVAVIDTGVDLLHEDLRAKLIGGHDFVDGDDVPQDRNGHGTHVAGVAAAETGNGLGVAGMAPSAVIMPLRVLDASGTGSEVGVAQAVDFAVLRARELGLRLVVNMSFTDLKTSGKRSQLIEDAIRRAWFAGAVIVAAAGNEALPFGDYPAAGPNVLAVGATDAADRRSSFSNRGATVVAPGEDVVSTYWDPADPDNHRAYATGSGTSMAAPFVSGLAALLLSQGLSNREVVDRIVRTADDLGPPGYDDDFGFGRVNAARALGVSTAGAAPPPAGGGGLDGVPRAQAGKFEELQPSPPPGSRAAGERGPGHAVPGAVAALLAAVAYVAARIGAGLQARRPEGR